MCDWFWLYLNSLYIEILVLYFPEIQVYGLQNMGCLYFDVIATAVDEQLFS